MTFRLLPRLLVFPVFAFVGQAFWMTQFPPESIPGCIFWIPVLTYAWFCVGGLSHELVHNNLPIPPWLTRFIARSIGTVIGIPYTVYRAVHMRHHAYLNTPLDWELWPYSDPAASLTFRRCFVWFDLLNGSLATPIILGRICFSRLSPVDAATKKVMRLEYVAIAVFWAGVLGLGFWLHKTGTVVLRPQHLIYALPLSLAANVNSARKMMEHLGTSSYDPVLGTRTVIGNNLITKLLSYFNFDLAIHGPHHRFPKLDHSLLATRMNEIVQDRQDEQLPVFTTFTSALRDTLHTLFVNPAVGINAGCTEDLSHLSGIAESVPPPNGEPVVHLNRTSGS